MSNSVLTVTEHLSKVFTCIDSIFEELQPQGTLQFKTLFGMVVAKLGLSDSQMRELDPVARYYIRNNPTYYVTRGAGGGIGLASVKAQRDSETASRESIKKKLKADLEAKLAKEENSDSE